MTESQIYCFIQQQIIKCAVYVASNGIITHNDKFYILWR